MQRPRLRLVLNVCPVSCSGLAYNKCSVNVCGVVNGRSSDQPRVGLCYRRRIRCLGRTWGLVSQVFMVSPDPKPFVQWLDSQKMARQTGLGLRWLCEEM